MQRLITGTLVFGHFLYPHTINTFLYAIWLKVMKARACTNHAAMWTSLCFWCCLQFFNKSPAFLSVPLSELPVLFDASPARFIFFLIFSQGWFDSFPLNPLLFLHLRSHNHSHPMLTPIHSCFPLFLFTPTLPPSLTFSPTARHSFPPPTPSVTLSLDLNEFHSLFFFAYK